MWEVEGRFRWRRRCRIGRGRERKAGDWRMRTCRCRGQRGDVLVSSYSCRGGTGFKGSSDAFGEVDAFRALHIIMTPMFFPDHAVISIYYNNAKLYCSKDRRSKVCGEERNNIRFLSYMTVDGYVEAEAGEKREKMKLRGPHQHEPLSR